MRRSLQVPSFRMATSRPISSSSAIGIVQVSLLRETPKEPHSAISHAHSTTIGSTLTPNPHAPQQHQQRRGLQLPSDTISITSYETIEVNVPMKLMPNWDEHGRPRTTINPKTGRFVLPWKDELIHKPPPGLFKWLCKRSWNKLVDGFYGLFSSSDMQEMPIMQRDPDGLSAPSMSDNHKARVTWLGHATCFIHCASGVRILTDPVFSSKAGPFGLFGPQRFLPASHKIEELGELDLILLSHDHYDHLDLPSLRRLSAKQWAVPLRMKDFLVKHAKIEPHRIIELEWWESFDVENDGIHLTCFPAHHWSTRMPWDRNERLWCSWGVATPSLSMYFGGDTGWPNEWPLLWRQIATEWQRSTGRPLDLALLPIGAYDPQFLMKENHINPYEAVQMHLELGATKSLGIHWGTFPLADEPPMEPKQMLQEAVQKAGVPETGFITLPHGGSMIV